MNSDFMLIFVSLIFFVAIGILYVIDRLGEGPLKPKQKRGYILVFLLLIAFFAYFI